MEMNRREFVVFAAAATTGAAAGCGAEGGGGGRGSGLGPAATVSVDAGPAADYAAEGVYDRFRDRGFFVVRENGRLFALSAICTHRRCKLNARPDHSFVCKCHGSTFDPAGRVTRGPAPRDLPVLPITTDPAGRLLVRVPAAG